MWRGLIYKNFCHDNRAGGGVGGDASGVVSSRVWVPRYWWGCPNVVVVGGVN